MRRFFLPALVICGAMFAAAPFLAYGAPYESTMGLVQKIFYYHAPIGMTMMLSAFVCGIASAVFLFKRRAWADRLTVAAAELTVLYGSMVLMTGPIWGRKAWGVWWEWDARLTSSLLLWMIYVAYLLVRRYGGPGSDTLAAGVALFGSVNVPFVYVSVNFWRTLHPKTSVVPSLGPGMRGPFWFCFAAFVVLWALLLAARLRLARQQAALDELYLALDERSA